MDKSIFLPFARARGKQTMHAVAGIIEVGREGLLPSPPYSPEYELSRLLCQPQLEGLHFTPDLPASCEDNAEQLLWQRQGSGSSAS